MQKLMLIFNFADQLCHCPHRAVDTPAAGPEKKEGDQSEYRGCKHYAVEAESELCSAYMEQCAVISPMPRHFKGPQQRYCLLQILSA